MNLLKSETKNLPVKLTQEQFNAKAKELSSLLQERASLEVTHKNRRDQMKEELSNIESRIGLAGGIVNRGEEYRDIITETYLGDNDTIIVKRTDTGETIETRAARPDELQLNLAVLDEEDQAEIAKADAISERLAAEEDATVAAPAEATATQESQQPVEDPPAKKAHKSKRLDLSTLKITTAVNGNNHRVELGGKFAESLYLVQATMLAFKANGMDENNPKALANEILKTFGDSPERRQILGILNPDETKKVKS
jgi:hypothetical protein